MLTRTLALAIVLAAPRAAIAAPERRFALLVTHRDGGVGTETLQYPSRDAHKLSDVLTEMGGFAPADVVRVEDPDPAALRTALAAVEGRIATAAAEGAQTLLVFYYSGHAGEGALRLGEARLPLSELQALLKGSRAGVRLAFLDACASGEVTRLKGGQRAPSFIVDNPAEASGYVVITSSRHDEASQESDDLRGSFFTHALVSGLRGAGDRNGDGAVTLNEAYEHAYHRTVARTADTRGGTQHPTYTYDLRGDGAVILTRLAGLGVLDFSAALPGSYLVYDPNRDVVVAEVELAADTPRKLSLRPGVYLVKKRADEHVLLESVVVPASGSASVEEARFTAVAFDEDTTKGPPPRVVTAGRGADAMARARADRRWLYLGASAGYQSFFDQPTRETLFHPTPLVGLRAEFPGLVARRVGVSFDAAYGETTGQFEIAGYPHAVDFALAVSGVGLVFDLPLGPLTAQLGPRLSGVYARRRFLDDDPLPDQDLFTFSPGAEAALRLPVSDLRFGLSGRVHYLRYATESEDRSLGFGEAFFAVEYAP